MEKLVLNRLNHLLVASLAGLALTACSPEEKIEQDKIEAYTVVSGTVEERSASDLEGVGVIRFRNTLSAVSGTQTFGLKGELIENNSTLTLISHAANPLLADGIQVRFIRSGERVRAEIEVNGGGLRTVTDSRLADLVPVALDLTVQIDNVTGQVARVVVWKEQRNSLPIQEALVDTSQAGHLDQTMSAGLGTGLFYGVRLGNAAITNFRLKE